jgi:hypothetical protein
MRVFENMVLEEYLNLIRRSFKTGIPRQTLLELSNLGGRDGMGMRNIQNFGRPRRRMGEIIKNGPLTNGV